MLTNFREIQRRVGARLHNTSTDTSEANDILPKIKDWINERYDRIWRSYPWPGTIDNYDLTLTASQEEYSFSRNVYKPWAIFDKTNGRPIKQDNIQNHIRNHAIDLEQTGNVHTGDPKRWRPVGTYTVKSETSQAETIDVVSTDNATDISPNVVRIVGEVNGVLTGENITLTGTNAATSSNTYDSGQKLRVSVGTSDGTRKTIVGIISVTGTTSGDTLAEISPQEFAHEYHWFRVSPKPKATGTQPTWEIWHSLPIEFLVNDNDIPIFDCSNELAQGAFADALREDGLEQEAEIAENKFVGMVKELMSKQGNPDEVEQFIPFPREQFRTLDFGRVIGSEI